MAKISALRRGNRPNHKVINGAPIMTPSAYAVISIPAVGIEIFKFSAIWGRKPIGENSVVPIAKAPMANASKGKFNFMRNLKYTAY